MADETSTVKWFCVDCGRRYATIAEAMNKDACIHGNIHRIGSPRDPIVSDLVAVIKGKERPQ